jgi:hypothetical protein
MRCRKGDEGAQHGGDAADRNSIVSSVHSGREPLPHYS